MPYLIDKNHIKLLESQDGRRKILKSQHEEVKNKYQAFKSLRVTAKYYGVDKRTIQFIVYPDRLKQLQEHNIQIKHHLKYYNKDKNTIAIRKTRQKRANLLININKAQ